MKSFMSKFKLLLISCLATVAIAFGALAFIVNDKVTADAAGVSLSNGEYSTDGSSIRIFKTADDVEATERTGLRFHVEMGDGYLYNGNPVINTSETNADNGSYKINDGFVTYTLIIPTRLLDGELSVDTPNVLKLNTSNFWYHDKDNNLESVAYIYNIPDHRYTDMFSFRGVICDSNGNLLAQTSVVERCVAEIARKSYDATNAGTEDWGSPERTQAAIDTLLGFIPVFDVIYQDANGNEIATERVMWGDAPTNAPKGDSFNSWYDTENSTEVDTSKAMHYPNGEVILTATKAEEFNLTGVAAEADFTVDSKDYHGVKVFATLHREAFTNKTQMDTHAVNMEHKRGDEILCDGIELQGVWTLEEQNELGEWQMRLFFGLDTSTLENGDKVIIKGDSVFYANGVMYKLTEDYTIDYTKVNDVEDYGMFLGYLYNSDVLTITNCAEDNTGNNGEPNEFTVRVEFYEDVMINGSFTFEFGAEVNTEEYPYPVFIKCGEDKTKLIPIYGGRYYWNEGNHKILELIGAGDYENKVFGWHNGDELIAAPGTIIKQNGGYYIFEDEMYGYFLTSGVDTWGYALGDWLVGEELDQYSASEFATEGSVTEITDYGTLADEIRINTTNHWFGQSKVNLLTVEKMSGSAPYAVYVTSKDGTVTEIDRIRYHGQEKPEGGNYQILGLCGEGKLTVGDVVTIAAGTRFWLATEYYTVTEELNYYYTGSFFVQSYDESTMGTLSSASFDNRAHNEGPTEMRMYFTAPLAGYTTNDQGAFDELRIGTGSIRFNGNPVTYLRYQRWDASSTWLSFGGYSGSVAFGDKLVIEAGTTIWGPNKVAYRFTEKVEWIYSANPAEANKTWSRVIGGVTIDATDVSNATVSGAGTLAVGETYTLNVAPVGDYVVSEVIINGNSKPISANGTYTFTVQSANTVVVRTVVGHKITFNIPEGAVVNGGDVINEGTIAVIPNGSITFSVDSTEGYKISSVSGATDNGNGTYTVSNVTSNITVSISVEKLYRVTYSGSNATVTANVANGTYVENGTQINVTAKANDGYTVIGATNATKVTKTTYTATVNGADLNINVLTMETGSFVKATSIIGIEDRTSWASGGHADIVTFGLMDFSITEGNQYFKSSVSDCWYKGNEGVIAVNNEIDILEYVYLNGVSARELLNANTAGNSTANTATWLSNPAAWPIAFETGTDCWIRIDKTKFDGGNFTFTLKAGFSLIRNDGAVCVVTNDIHYTYENGTLSGKTVDAPEYTVNFDNADKVTVSVNSGAISNGAKVAEDTEITISSSNPLYKVYAVTVNGTAVAVNNGICTFTLEDNVTIAITVLNVNTVDITDRIQIEDRSWGAHDGEVYVGMLDTGITHENGTQYFNTSVNGAWYVGNDAIIEENGGLDIMEYIYINDTSARDLITANANGDRLGNSCGCWLSNPAAYPVYVETTNGSGLMMRFATATFGTEFTITIKAGFRITDANGNVVIVTKDIVFTYKNGTITKTVTQ